MLKLAVVIPTFNRRHSLENLLKGLLSQRLPHEVSVAFFIVVDGSTDDTLEMIGSLNHEEIHIVEGSGNWWFTKCLNEGIKEAKSLGCNTIMFFNDDLEVPEDYLVEMITAFRQKGEESLIGPLQFSNQNRQQVFGSGIKEIIWWRFKYKPYLKKFSQVKRAELHGLHPSYLLTTRGMITSMAVVNELNGFDGQMVQYGSDDDFCLRALKKGCGVFLTMDTELYVNVDMTSKGSSNSKSTLKEFVNSFSNQYSSNSVSFLKLTLIKHSTFRPWIIPLTMSLLGRVKNFVKRNYL